MDWEFELDYHQHPSPRAPVYGLLGVLVVGVALLGDFVGELADQVWLPLVIVFQLIRISFPDLGARRIVHPFLANRARLGDS